MDIIVNLLAYFLLVHLVARRGLKTGLYYQRVFVMATFFLPIVAVWVFWRNKRYEDPRITYNS